MKCLSFFHSKKNTAAANPFVFPYFQIKGLKQRGQRSVDLVVSDDHGGLVCSIRQQLQGVTWQRCQTHFMRNILDVTPKSLQDEIYKHVRAILDAPDLAAARMLLNQTLAKFGEKTPKAMRILETGFDDVTAVLCLPEKYRQRLRTTNWLERLNAEIRRWERVIQIFPNRESTVRLIGAVLMEIDEKWATAKKFCDMAEYYEWSKNRHTASAKITRVM